MTPTAVHSTTPAAPSDPLVDAARALEEHHVAAWSPVETDRARFSAGMELLIRKIPDTTVCVIAGQQIRDLYSLCAQLELALDIDRIRRQIDGRGGLVEALQTRSGNEESRLTKRRYYIWRDADVLLNADHRLFGRIVDALAGVAAAAEYSDEDRLFLQRTVFVGGPALAGYAEDPSGQFCTWFSEGGERPLWSVRSGLAAPPVEVFQIPTSPEPC